MENNFFNVPYADEIGAGEEEDLQKIRRQLIETKRAIIVDAPGARYTGGETRMAAAYACRFRDRYGNGVIWIDAAGSIDLQLIHIAINAGWIHPGSGHMETLKGAVQRLVNLDNCLVIFDGVSEQAALKPYLPDRKRGPHVLVTGVSALDERTDFHPVEIKPGTIDVTGVLQAGREAVETDTVLKDLMDFLAWSGAAFMGTDLIAAALDKTETELAETLDKGISLGLLQKAVDGESCQASRAVGRPWQEAFPIAGRKEWVSDICQRLGDWFEQRRKPADDLPAFEVEFIHLVRWTEHAKLHSPLQACRLTWLQAYPPYYLERYGQSLKLVEDALALLENEKEPEPGLKANILNDYGSISGALSKHGQSLDYHIQALEIQRAHFDDQHPDTIQFIENIGATHTVMGNHEEALKSHLDVLEIRRAKFGARHLETATSLDNVGSVYGELGNHEEAVNYHQQALEIREQLLDRYHPDTAEAFFNVIYAQIKLKNFKEASERLTAYLEDFPGDHPEHERFMSLKRFLNKQRIKGSSKIPSKKKKKKKK
jgi:tetratricopeptide (TPR) repeat protein